MDAVEEDEQPVARAAELEQPDDDQGDLFARPAASDDWPGEQEGERPSAEELEEAAAHFADPAERKGRGVESSRVHTTRTRSRPDGRMGAEQYPPGEEYETPSHRWPRKSYSNIASAPRARRVPFGSTAAVGGADLDRRGTRGVPARSSGIVWRRRARGLLDATGCRLVASRRPCGRVSFTAHGEHHGSRDRGGLVSGALVLGCVLPREAGPFDADDGVLAPSSGHDGPGSSPKPLGNIGLTLLGLLYPRAAARC